MSHLHLLAGSNGSGKTTLYERVIRPITGLPFVNADEIAKALAGGAEIDEELSIRAAQMAAQRREEMIAAGTSFVAETVFSHPSKVDLVHRAIEQGYVVHLYVVVVPVELTVARVRARVSNGGHDVPEDRVRARHRRLWAHMADATRVADETTIYDNTSAAVPFRTLAQLRRGNLVPGWAEPWPGWVPPELHPDRFAGSG